MANPLADFLANNYFLATAGSNPNRSLAEYNTLLGAHSGSFGINQYHTNLGFALASGGLGGSVYPSWFTNLDERIIGTVGNDIIFAEGGNDIVDGGAGNDYLAGAEGNDQLVGNVGNDYLIGRTGNDQLVGGAGSDLLMGGTQADTFVFGSPSEGVDTIVDFNWGAGVGFVPRSGDKILISIQGFGVDARQINRFSFRDIGNDAYGGLYFDQTLFAILPLASGFSPRSDIQFF